MGAVYNRCALFLLCLTVWSNTPVSPTKIEIRPGNTVVQGESVNMYCSFEDLAIKRILSVQLLRADRYIAAVMDEHSSVHVNNRYEATGQVAEDKRKTHLLVTIKNTKTTDSNKYSCKIYYLNIHNKLIVDKVDDILTVSEQKVSDIDNTVEYLLKKVSLLDQEVHAKDRKINDLKSDLYTHRQELEAGKYLDSLQDDRLNATKLGLRNAMDAVRLNEKKIRVVGTKMDERNGTTAFTMLYTAADTPQNDSLIRFSQTATNIGGGYDVHRGMFIAPTDGLYVFHLVITISRAFAPVQTAIIARGREVAALGTSPDNSFVQSSISAVVSLKAGHTVYPVMRWGRGIGIIYPDSFSAFSGFLLA